MTKTTAELRETARYLASTGFYYDAAKTMREAMGNYPGLSPSVEPSGLVRLDLERMNETANEYDRAEWDQMRSDKIRADVVTEH
jgi:hypothetical protein